VLLRDGGVIAPASTPTWTSCAAINQNCDAFLLDLEARERAHRHRQPARAVQQGARLLHRGHQLGPGQGAGRLPAPADAEERRALHHARAEDLRGQGLSAQERALAREKWLYEQLLDHLQQHLATLQALARALATLDALAALAERAPRWAGAGPSSCPTPASRSRPAATRWSRRGWPKPAAASFIANHCRLDAKTRMLVITGPNMGGKSTFMRQVALIVLLAAMGSYVPATACRLGPIDAIHTRIGAADDLANAQSTFMVEMTEAAAIVHAPPNRAWC
jgi:DNA mismatch repair protein MutS